MKKTLKKLTLHRDTLRSLEETGLQPVAGGGPTATDCSVTCRAVQTSFDRAAPVTITCFSDALC